MSSNRRARAIRTVAIIALAGLAAACATPKPPRPVTDRAGLTTTEQFSIHVSSQQDQIQLAPHAEGLSAAQRAALAELVERWQDAGGGPIVIQTPSHGGGETYRSATNVELELAALGVMEDRIKLVGYDSEDHPGSPIVVGFDHFTAKGPVCGRSWDNFTSTNENKPDSNFGCAVTANLAALVANPADLAQPRPVDPADAGRREVVLGKYRAGQTTSSAKDEQATGAISNAIN